MRTIAAIVFDVCLFAVGLLAGFGAAQLVETRSQPAQRPALANPAPEMAAGDSLVAHIGKCLAHFGCI